MNSIEALKMVMECTGYTQTTAAPLVGWTKQQLNSRMMRGNMKTEEWLELLNSMGVEVKLVYKESGEPVVMKKRAAGIGPRAKGMSDGVKYDTSKAEPLANSFYLDGENKYTDGTAEELYKDDQDRYFLVTYTDQGDSKIHHVNSTVAEAFIEKYSAKREVDQADN